ncbi:MAG: sigma 54-interacting transcriptional regulator [Proteobacteria bacterium]|nr:sigma 54-interacting transcriptional regulator [Pseudomonadota bacterium]
MNFDALPEVALARDLLRRWWSVDLDFAGLGDLPKVKHGACEAARTLATGTCADTLRALATTFAKSRAITTVPCHAGLLVVAAPVVEYTGAVAKLAGIVHASGIPAATSEAELTRIRDLVGSAAAAVDRARPAIIAPTTFVHLYTEIVGDAPAVRDVVKLLGKVVKSEATVLIHGESGTGKELIARAIHYHGPRAKKPFVVQNCSAFNDNLLESALFGHVRGAFTGAVKDQPGLFQTADGGTFFLDEIGDMSAALQVKLLRVLQEGTLMPVGGTKSIKVDVRIIAASHKDLQKMVDKREFRDDLFYRVNVLKITVPPLRDRTSDIPRLAQHFITKHWRTSATGTPPPRLSQGALARLVAHAWPGNIRELENEMERMLVLAGSDTQELVASMVSPRVAGSGGGTDVDRRRPLRDLLAVAESDAIVAALGRHVGDRELVAEELEIGRELLDARIVALGLGAPPGSAS